MEIPGYSGSRSNFSIIRSHLFCVSSRRRRDLAQAEGLVVVSEVLDNNGRVSTRQKKNMHLLIAQGSERQMVGILRDLGLTALARDKSKPLVAPEEASDCFRALLPNLTFLRFHNRGQNKPGAPD